MTKEEKSHYQPKSILNKSKRLPPLARDVQLYPKKLIWVFTSSLKDQRKLPPGSKKEDFVKASLIAQRCPSNISKCRHCGETINKGDTRIGYPTKDVRGEYGIISSYLHVKCSRIMLIGCLGYDPLDDSLESEEILPALTNLDEDINQVLHFEEFVVPSDEPEEEKESKPKKRPRKSVEKAEAKSQSKGKRRKSEKSQEVEFDVEKVENEIVEEPEKEKKDEIEKTENLEEINLKKNEAAVKKEEHKVKIEESVLRRRLKAYNMLKEECYGFETLFLPGKVLILKAFCSVSTQEHDLDENDLLNAVPRREIPSVEPPAELSDHLLPFQKEGLSWMTAQEANEDIKGGILADEMGMGKTIQTIALILKQKSSGSFSGPTLVVTPVAALLQWKSEIEKFAKDSITVLIYHGSLRSSLNCEILESHDVVLTTYASLEHDYRREVNKIKVFCRYCGRLFLPNSLKVHQRYHCGPNATRTLKQSKTEKNLKAAKKAMQTLDIGDGEEDEVFEVSDHSSNNEAQEKSKPSFPTISTIYREIIDEAGRGDELEGPIPWFRSRSKDRQNLPDAGPPPSKTDIQKMGVAKIKEQLYNRGLQTHGGKAELIGRLMLHLYPSEFEVKERPHREKKKKSAKTKIRKATSNISSEESEESDSARTRKRPEKKKPGKKRLKKQRLTFLLKQANNRTLSTLKSRPQRLQNLKILQRLLRQKRIDRVLKNLLKAKNIT
eukprot:GHVP01063374.1.p1 GENE.GHVP01063374.1~~GHVP01063374.1.p1  ORF type:complete len:722 (-),score=154.40 GHVP01063374.1:1743-3908(-)